MAEGVSACAGGGAARTNSRGLLASCSSPVCKVGERARLRTASNVGAACIRGGCSARAKAPRKRDKCALGSSSTRERLFHAREALNEALSSRDKFDPSQSTRLEPLDEPGVVLISERVASDDSSGETERFAPSVTAG